MIRPLLALVALFSACYTPEGQHWNTTLGTNTTVWDDYEAEVNAFGLVATGDIDYSLTAFEVGATRVEPQAGRDLKHEFAGLMFGIGDIDDNGSLDLTEIGGGGRIYFDNGGELIPFLSIWSTIVSYDDLDDLDAQFGLRFGGGVEFVLTDNAALQLGLDYHLPLIPAEDTSSNAELEIQGLAARFGLVFML